MLTATYFVSQNRQHYASYLAMEEVFSQDKSSIVAFKGHTFNVAYSVLLFENRNKIGL